MKHLLLLTIFILCSSFVLADNIYQYDYLDLQLKIDGKFDLIPESSSAKISNVKVNLLLYPENDHRQQLKEIVTFGELENGKLVFEWNDKQIEEKEYGYTALVNTINSRNKVKNRVQFPLSKIDVDHDYLLPTLKIDSDNPDIIAKATEIAEGEDDLFKVTFKLASWIDENIDYDLNELTTNKAQKASWVLEHRQGVCDEMASLFVAMCRSLGIPAKFVSGISYTTSPEVVNTVGSNWAGHGWAEVYFPNIGWVSFDLTFTEYGYIDVTHIKLTEGLDTDDASTETKFEWLANDVNLQSFPPETTVEIVNKGMIQKEEIVLEQEILDNNVDPGSYNLIKGILKNTADYYVATTLKLALPKEVEVIGRDKRQILLSPKEVRETYWIVKVSDNLDKKYSYTFPVLIYSEKNTTVKDTFSASSGENFYSLSDIEELTVSDEEKVYSRRIFFSCDYQREVELNTEVKAKCSIKNSGNTNLDQIKFCLNNNCELVDLPINQKVERELELNGTVAGWQKILISAENDLIEKKSSFEYLVLDSPSIKIEFNYPAEINYGDKLEINTLLTQQSVSIPENVVVKIKGFGFSGKWELEKLKDQQTLLMELENLKLSRKNKFEIKTTWEDNFGKTYSDQQEIIVIAKSQSFKQKITMLFNGFLKIFV